MFEVSTPMELYRVEGYGGEEAFTTMILEEVRAGDIVYDIGACVGLVSVHAAKKGATVYSFEPDPFYRSRLIINLNLNRLHKVKVIEWAVSDGDGEASLFTDGAGGLSPSLRKIGERGCVNVKTGSIENALSRGEILTPDIIKLDIEGAEILALRGMQQLLASSKGPRAVFLEVHPDFLKHFGSSEEEAEGVLLKSGYTLSYKTERSAQMHCIFRK